MCSPLLRLAAFALVTGLASSARADEEPPPAAPAPSAARAGNGEYVAPLAQQTQRSYVPQSVAMSGPRVLSDWEDGAPVPDGYHAESRVRRGLVIAGAVTFGTTYLLSIIGASAAVDAAYGDRTPAASLFVPVAGPFIYAGQVESATGRAFLVIDGLAQTAGAAMLLYGLASPKTVLVRNDLGLRVTAAPMHLGRDGSGAGLVGTF